VELALGVLERILDRREGQRMARVLRTEPQAGLALDDRGAQAERHGDDPVLRRTGALA